MLGVDGKCEQCSREKSQLGIQSHNCFQLRKRLELRPAWQETIWEKRGGRDKNRGRISGLQDCIADPQLCENWTLNTADTTTKLCFLTAFENWDPRKLSQALGRLGYNLGEDFTMAGSTTRLSHSLCQDQHRHLASCFCYPHTALANGSASLGILVVSLDTKGSLLPLENESAKYTKHRSQMEQNVFATNKKTTGHYYKAVTLQRQGKLQFLGETAQWERLASGENSTQVQSNDMLLQTWHVMETRLQLFTG